MSSKSYYLKGSWSCVCDRCGVEYKSGELQKEWNGLMTCSNCFEQRQPQDFVRGVADIQTVPWSRDEPADTFIPFCTPNSITAIADFAKAGCAIADLIHPLFDPAINE
ncbi:hypothetical protein UFOVP1590_14 [uncultured Caudovirales phage]|uniref:Uncharacterized protein n=1 Tax=uncultured Caudovirales phage TaxID=2100421 RepID=A0A6J5SMZ8_9CAUD|nr:hypothetical protein UFOVP1590_14 [uncultured Caudovirales phage]